MSKSHCGVLALCSFGLACGAQDVEVIQDTPSTPSVARTVSAVGTSNGTTFNGISYSGYSLETTYLSSYYAPTMFWTSYSLTYDPLSGVGPNGSSLTDSDVTALDWPEDTTTGFDLVGASLAAALENGEQVVLKIEDVSLDEGFFNYLVTVEKDEAGATVREPLCGLDTFGVPIGALAVPGVWDLRAGEVGGGSWSPAEGEFTFACRGSSIAKCIELGYRPNLDSETLDGANHLVACVRMLRADYCGDGTSWTTDGRLVDVWDKEGTNVQTEDTWPLEAAWSASGAICLTDPRYTFPDESAVPFCAARLKWTSCDWWRDWGIIFNSFPRDGENAETETKQNNQPSGGQARRNDDDD